METGHLFSRRCWNEVLGGCASLRSTRCGTSHNFVQLSRRKRRPKHPQRVIHQPEDDEVAIWGSAWHFFLDSKFWLLKFQLFFLVFVIKLFVLIDWSYFFKDVSHPTWVCRPRVVPGGWLLGFRREARHPETRSEKPAGRSFDFWAFSKLQQWDVFFFFLIHFFVFKSCFIFVFPTLHWWLTKVHFFFFSNQENHKKELRWSMSPLKDKQIFFGWLENHQFDARSHQASTGPECVENQEGNPAIKNESVEVKSCEKRHWWSAVKWISFLIDFLFLFFSPSFRMVQYFFVGIETRIRPFSSFWSKTLRHLESGPQGKSKKKINDFEMFELNLRNINMTFCLSTRFWSKFQIVLIQIVYYAYRLYMIYIYLYLFFVFPIWWSNWS